MKASVAKIYTKMAEELKKVLSYLAASKQSRAEKKLKSLVSKAEQKVSKAKAPKKARKPNAYALFVQKYSKKVAAANPGLKQTEIMKLLSKMYKGELAAPASVKKSPVKAKKSPAKKSPKPKASPKKRGRKPKSPKA